MMYVQLPGEKLVAIQAKIPPSVAAFAAAAVFPLMNPTAVNGSIRMAIAKIGGITPDVFSFNGMNELWP